MVDFPTYLKPVIIRAERKAQDQNASRPTNAQTGDSASASQAETTAQTTDKVVLQFPKSRLNRGNGQAPTKLEAQLALKQLQQDLPNAGSKVGSLHEFADRRRILSLLTPLMED